MGNSNQHALETLHLDPIDDQIDFIFILGVAQGIGKLVEWLNQTKFRKVFIIDNNVDAISAYCKEAMVDHPRLIHCFVQDKKQLEGLVIEQGLGYPLVIQVRDDVFTKEVIYETSVVTNAYISDILEPQVYFKNFYSNIVHVTRSEKIDSFTDHLQDLPIVLFGSGPSFNNHLADWKHLQDRAWIFTAGSAASVVSQAGLMPHLCFVVDPNDQQAHTLQNMQCPQSPVLFTLRVKKGVLDLFEGTRFYIPFSTQDPRENYFDELLGIEDNRSSRLLDTVYSTAGLFALQKALLWSKGPVWLVGFDLCFQDNTLYAQGVDPVEVNQDALLEKKETVGTRTTTLKWKIEKQAIEQLARKFPGRLYRIRGDGIPIEGVQEGSFEEMMQMREKKGDFGFDVPSCRSYQRPALDAFDQIEKELIEIDKIFDAMDANIHPVYWQCAQLELVEIGAWQTFFAQVDHFLTQHIVDVDPQKKIEKKKVFLEKAIQLHLQYLKEAKTQMKMTYQKNR